MTRRKKSAQPAKRRPRPATRTAITWIEHPRELRDVFGKPVQWEGCPVRPVYLDGLGRRVAMRRRVTVGMPEDMREVVERAAAATGRPMSEVARQALIRLLGQP